MFHVGGMKTIVSWSTLSAKLANVVSLSSLPTVFRHRQYIWYHCVGREQSFIFIFLSPFMQVARPETWRNTLSRFSVFSISYWLWMWLYVKSTHVPRNDIIPLYLPQTTKIFWQNRRDDNYFLNPKLYWQALGFWRPVFSGLLLLLLLPGDDVQHGIPVLMLEPAAYNTLSGKLSKEETLIEKVKTLLFWLLLLLLRVLY